MGGMQQEKHRVFPLPLIKFDVKSLSGNRSRGAQSVRIFILKLTNRAISSLNSLFRGGPSRLNHYNPSLKCLGEITALHEEAVIDLLNKSSLAFRSGCYSRSKDMRKIISDFMYFTKLKPLKLVSKEVSLPGSKVGWVVPLLKWLPPELKENY